MNATPPPRFREALRVWWQLGWISFGGPAGQIALMHRLVVEERRWLKESQFLNALNYCMLLPGPEAQQLATYIGWRLHGTRGGIAAGLLFILPGFLLMLLIAGLYVLHGTVGWIQGLLFGLQCATLAIVVEAVLRVGRKALRHPLLWSIAGVAFLGIFAFGIPFPLIIALAAGLGIAGLRWAPQAFAGTADAGAVSTAAPSPGWTLRILLAGAALWGLPLLVLLLTLGAGHVYTDLALFFSKMAVVSFGGAYAVLAYMTQQAVERYGWLSTGEMIQGLGLAETTPGPLILVLTYVGFLAAFRDPAPLDALLAGSFGATLATWVTFVPCFLWIFLGAPYLDRLQQHRALSAALTAVTAAVVGVILNLSLWFALHVLFADLGTWQAGPVRLPLPVADSLDPTALLLGSLALIGLLSGRIRLLPLLGMSAVAGLMLSR